MALAAALRREAAVFRRVAAALAFVVAALAFVVAALARVVAACAFLVAAFAFLVAAFAFVVAALARVAAAFARERPVGCRAVVALPWAAPFLLAAFPFADFVAAARARFLGAFAPAGTALSAPSELIDRVRLRASMAAS